MSVRHSAITVIRAPAGSGKSALVSAWARTDRPPGPVAWLSLTSDDSQRGRFWRQVFLALAETGANERVAGLALPSPHAIEVLLSSMVTAVASLERPIVMVLDDLHEVDDEQVMADLGALLRSPPPGLRFVVCTRSDPALRLQRLRLAGLVSDIAPSQLVFSLLEAGELFAAGGLDLAPADTERLWSRTEGWAAGLALTALTLRARSDPRSFIDEFAGDVAPVADYLLEEVLADQPAAVRTLLLQTSVLNAVSGDLADALTGQTGSAVILERLHHGGVLTMAMDDHREWYRFHGLLRDLMRSMLRRDDPALFPILNARAARWLADHDRPVPAARHAVSANDVAFLESVSLSRGFSLLARGQIGELAGVLSALPRPTLEHHAPFCLVLAAAAIEMADGEEADRWMRHAAACGGELPEHQRGLFEAGMAIMRLYEARLTGDVHAALAAARPYVTRTDVLSGFPFTDAADMQALVLVNLGAIELWLGDFTAAAHDLDRGLAAATAQGRRFLQCHALAHVAALKIWGGDVVGGEEMAREAMKLADAHGWNGTSHAGMALTVLSMAAALRGDVERSQALFDEAAPTMADGVEEPLRLASEIHHARLLRLHGEHDRAIALLERVGEELSGTPWEAGLARHLKTELGMALRGNGQHAQARTMLEELPGEDLRLHTEVTLALILLESGEPADAVESLRAWDDAIPDAMLPATSTEHVRALICLARAHRELGDATAGRVHLERALALAEPYHRRLPFLEHGEKLDAPLRELVTHGTAHPVFAAEIRRLLSGEDRPATERAQVEVEELSGRELDVLRYLPTMLTNREIAGELVVSVNTVKTHLKQIYAKLGAHDRRDAVRRARALGLLSGSTLTPPR